MSRKMRPIRPFAFLALLIIMGCSAIFAAGALRLTASADRSVASPENPAVIRVTAANVGSDRATWGSGSSTCQFHLLVRIDGVDLFAPSSRICTADLRTFSLKPGESRTEALDWAGQVKRELSSRATEWLEPGIYEVRGAAGEVAKSAPVLVEVRVGE